MKINLLLAYEMFMIIIDGKKTRAALFDLDGVVFDTEGQYTLFWGSQCRLYHPDKPGLEYQIKGQTLVQIFDKYFADLQGEQPKIVARLEEYERKMDYSYIDGLVDFVFGLRRAGIKTAVVTSSNLAKMEAVYSSRPEFKEMFDAILTAEDFDRSKPDPDCYLKAAARFCVRPDECFVFEDSFNGLKAGRAAGMTVVGLATTNPVETINPFCDIVVKDFRKFGIKK